ncbi:MULTISPECIES: ATPase [unclassified Marinobacter]|uniref:ATPase n=1 Tax=unclassified Marinobacter TaxID=83889 RepID=UPI0026E388FC|nr:MULTISPECIES: ATPase [unclassified Marinobacter]MDO6441363.1 ATPase [Marinobacter sp. 2_MG-2023]MDO6822458.1 ATPase [Marinobacter sp. 1_MG-2023]
MEIKTFGDLIDWTRQLHSHLARCLQASAEKNSNERASALLDYISRHETLLAKAVGEFESQADPKALNTRVYDYLNHKPIKVGESCDTRFNTLDFDDISREIFAFHDQVMDLYDSLIGKAEIEEAKTLLEDLLALEQHEAMRLSSQIGRMNDI